VIVTRYPSRPALLLLALVLLVGSYLRLSHLDWTTFSNDELDHYYAGVSLAEGRGPALPSGARYSRGIEYSFLVSRLAPHLRSPELATRLPAALAGTLGLILFAWIAWRMAGPGAALGATLLLAFYPEAVRLSRFGRFYTLQALAALVAMYASWRLVRGPGLDRGLHGSSRAWGWALLAIGAFAIAALIQVVTLAVATGVAVLIAGIGVLDSVRDPRSAWKQSVPFQLTILGLLVATAVLLIQPPGLQRLIQEAGSMPLWARLSHEGPAPVTLYYTLLSANYPVLVALGPVIFLVPFLRSYRLGWFLLAWFAVPVLLLSLLFPWKLERFILVAMPALFLAAGIAAAEAASLMQSTLERWLHSQGRTPPQARWISFAASALIVVFAFITLPAFNRTRWMLQPQVSDGWRESRAILETRPDLHSLPLGAASPLPALHYWGDLDFVVQRALLESRKPAAKEKATFENPFEMKPMGSKDIYSGRRIYTTPAAIRNRFGDVRAVIIGIERKYVSNRNIEPELLKILRRDAIDLCENRCGAMLLYYWPMKRDIANR
jgi:hypothetical protein